MIVQIKNVMVIWAHFFVRHISPPLKQYPDTIQWIQNKNCCLFIWSKQKPVFFVLFSYQDVQLHFKILFFPVTFGIVPR